MENTDDKRALLHKLGASHPKSTLSYSNTSYSKKGWMIALLLIASAAGYYLFSKDMPTKPDSPEQAEAISPEKDKTPANNAAPQENRTGNSLMASGYVVARREATISAEITGKITEILVEEGMKVEKGELIARLDDTLAITERDVAEARRKSALSSIKSLKAQLREAQDITNRRQKLYHSGVVSEAALTEGKARSDSLVAQIEQLASEAKAAELEVKRYNQLIEKYALRAPFTGVVTDKNAQPGEIISPMSAGGGFTRTGVATIVDMDSLEVEVDVNEASISAIRSAMPAEVTLDAYPHWQIPAEVIAVIPTASREKATIQVRVRLKEKDPRILPNMAVKVRFLLSQS